MTPTCNHTKSDGTLCGSPAVTGTPLCYFHARILDRALRMPEGPITLPTLDSPAAVLAALSQLTLAIARNGIDLPRANILLRALTLATRLTTTIAKDAAKSKPTTAELPATPELESHAEPAAHTEPAASEPLSLQASTAKPRPTLTLHTKPTQNNRLPRHLRQRKTHPPLAS